MKLLFKLPPPHSTDQSAIPSYSSHGEPDIFELCNLREYHTFEKNPNRFHFCIKNFAFNEILGVRVSYAFPFILLIKF